MIVHDDKVTVPTMTAIPPPDPAELPVMVHESKVTVPPPTKTPPPPAYPAPKAVLPVIEQDVIVTVPE